MEQNTIGEQLRAWRLAAMLNQDQAAAKLHTSQSNYSKIEGGKTNPSHALRGRIVDLLRDSYGMESQQDVGWVSQSEGAVIACDHTGRIVGMSDDVARMLGGQRARGKHLLEICGDSVLEHFQDFESFAGSSGVISFDRLTALSEREMTVNCVGHSVSGKGYILMWFVNKLELNMEKGGVIHESYEDENIFEFYNRRRSRL